MISTDRNLSESTNTRPPLSGVKTRACWALLYPHNDLYALWKTVLDWDFQEKALLHLVKIPAPWMGRTGLQTSRTELKLSLFTQWRRKNQLSNLALPSGAVNWQLQFTPYALQCVWSTNSVTCMCTGLTQKASKGNRRERWGQTERWQPL